jgi:peptide-methionine (R)-S-oxide reductase
MGDKVIKSTEDWRRQLTPEEFAICREGATERPFTGKYNDCKTPGVYQCKCCGAPLFDSETKFESGTGWPSFFQPADPKAVAEHPDHSLGMVRTEVTCMNCGAHLGHVFEDGPRPTRLRYCINSASLNLKER